MSLVFINDNDVRRIVRDEINNHEYRNALFKTGTPITSDIMDGKLGTFHSPFHLSSKMKHPNIFQKGVNALLSEH